MPKYVVYLLHFDKPIHRSRHYLGYTSIKAFEHRMVQHASGHGARLTRRACELKIKMVVAHIWITDSPDLERRLKKRHNARHWCSFCRDNLPTDAIDGINDDRNERERPPEWTGPAF